jgi:carbon monoxide dehydrogenase subunit G
MARYKGTVTSHHPASAVWSYLADLRSVAEWDPSVDEIRLLSGNPGTVGARYQLEVSFLGNRVSLPYVTVTADPPTRVVFSAETESVVVRDEARVRPLADGGSSVTWDADLRLKAARRLFDPLLRLAFNRLGRRAARGLGERLTEITPPRVGEETHA